MPAAKPHVRVAYKPVKPVSPRQGAGSQPADGARGANDVRGASNVHDARGASGATSAHGASSVHGAHGASDPFLRAENEDDDGYDPYSDRPAEHEPLFERDPWR